MNLRPTQAAQSDPVLKRNKNKIHLQQDMVAHSCDSNILKLSSKFLQSLGIIDLIPSATSTKSFTFLVTSDIFFWRQIYDGSSINCTLISPLPFSRKNTEIPCLHPVFNSKSYVSARSVQPTLVFMTTTAVWQTTLGESYIWDSFRYERSLIS